MRGVMTATALWAMAVGGIAHAQTSTALGQVGAEAQAAEGAALFKAGRWEDGERLLKAALATFAAPGAPATLAEPATLATLGDSYLRWGRYEDGRAALVKAIALYEARSGVDAPELLPVLSSLATLHLTLGEEGAAEPLYRRQIAIAQKIEPQGGPRVAAAMNDLALLYSVVGRGEEALPLFEAAEAAFARADAKDPALGNAYREHALAFVRLERGPEAEAMAEKALTQIALSEGPESEIAGTAQLTLARVKFAVGKNDEGQAAGQRGLDIYRKVLSAENPRIGDALFQLGFAAQRKLDRDNAERYYDEALKAMEAGRPAHHESVVYTRSSLSQQIMRGKADPSRAYEMSRLAADALRQRLVANARLVGRNGAPTVAAADRNVFFIAVRSGWALDEAGATAP